MKGQFAIVTGASSGIGFSLAKELAARGYDLAICSSGESAGASCTRTAFAGSAGDRDRRGLSDARRRKAILGRSAIAWTRHRCCLSQCRRRCRRPFRRNRFGRRTEDGVFELRGTVQLAKYVVQNMLSRNEGRILFTASIAGEMVAPREAVYAATKAFGLSFAHSLRYELRDTGISVTALQPGPTNTDFFHRAGMDNTEVGSEGKKESQPDDVARQGIEALLSGKDHVYAASAKTKVEGMLANITPGSVKGAMHEKMAKPKAS